MPDMLLALHDGMVLHPIRALCTTCTFFAALGLVLCTLLGLIPLAVWGDVLTAPFVWLCSGAGWLIAAKLSGLALLLFALCVVLAVWAEGQVKQP